MSGWSFAGERGSAADVIGVKVRVNDGAHRRPRDLVELRPDLSRVRDVRERVDDDRPAIALDQDGVSKRVANGDMNAVNDLDDLLPELVAVRAQLLAAGVDVMDVERAGDHFGNVRSTCPLVATANVATAAHTAGSGFIASPHPGPCTTHLLLQRDTNQVNPLRLAEIGNRVRRLRSLPIGNRVGNRGRLTRVEQDSTLAVSVDEVTCLVNVKDTGPAMRMGRFRFAGLNGDVQNPNAVRFKQHPMVGRCGRDRIHRLGPPRPAPATRCQTVHGRRRPQWPDAAAALGECCWARRAAAVTAG